MWFANKNNLGVRFKSPLFFDMNKELLRNFIISVLDDDHGISERSFSILNKIAEQDKSLHDVVLAADAHDDRFFLNEEDATMFKK